MLSHRLELKGHIQTIVNVLFKIIDLLVLLSKEKRLLTVEGEYFVYFLCIPNILFSNC